jgi:hypothetical protein
VNNKEKNSEDFCLDLVQEFGLCSQTGNKVIKINNEYIYRGKAKV